MIIRFFILQAHYRSPIDFSNDALKAAEKGFTKLMNAIETLETLNASNESTYNVNDLEKKCYDAMNDDFNTPILIAHLFDGVRIINSTKSGKERLSESDIKKLKSIFADFSKKILGLNCIKENYENNLTSEIMELVLKLRENAKKNKDFDTADLIRDKLNNSGIQIKDNRDGTSWEII